MRCFSQISLLFWVLGCNGNISAESTLGITHPSAKAPDGFSQIFYKQVDVFGVQVYATAATPDRKVLHTANVLAQYLDNDADGRPDNHAVVDAMRKNKAAMIMFATEQDSVEIDLEAFIPIELLDSMALQDLYGEETHPGGAMEGRFDATLEEVLHLITSAGYADAYPDIFGEKPGTAIAQAMDIARGGYFEQVPRRYPQNAWYTYYDKTCDYGCQITEYIYWALTSILGGQDFPGRAEEIHDEWRLNTPNAVQQGDRAVCDLLTDPQYRFPTRLPDGQYRIRQKQ